MDFLKDGDGRNLKLPQLVDMAAQVRLLSQQISSKHLLSITGTILQKCCQIVKVGTKNHFLFGTIPEQINLVICHNQGHSRYSDPGSIKDTACRIYISMKCTQLVIREPCTTAVLHRVNHPKTFNP